MRTKGFTLVEVIIVLMIIGMIAAFAVPNWQKSIERADEKEIVHNLNMLYEASRLYITRGGAFDINDLSDRQEINDTFGIQIMESSVTYSCGSDTVVYCAGTAASGWHIRVDLEGANEGDVNCPAGNSCPSGAGAHY
jgi:prepilin-type N-terminal cleavage/methylation domain-containing protein